MGSNPKEIIYKYHFRFKDGSEKEFEIRLDYDTLTAKLEPKETYPKWTELEVSKCPDCPLDSANHKHCPVAVNIVDLIEFFKDSVSYEEADVEVIAANRTYVCHTSLQHAVSSLMGILMATAGCPVLDKLRPMVDTHLPFPSPDETTYRILSMYLIAQYFLYKRSKSADWDLAKLMEFLNRIEKVNAAFCKRLNSIDIRDASINAVINLNFLSAFTGLSLERGRLERLQKIFNAAYSA